MNIYDNPDRAKLIYKKIYINLLENSKYCEDDNFKMELDYSYNLDDIKNFKQNFDIESLKWFNEVQTFIEATKWVSKTLYSDLEANPPVVSVVELIHDIINKKYAANCYAHAVVLNEVFCALGYKCKYIFCMPIDFHFTDCHVVNLVWSETQEKWMLFDSANGLYYTDENNVILDIQELRNRIIANYPVNVNLFEIFYTEVELKNNEIIKHKILTYMSKNLYRFSVFKRGQTDFNMKNSIIERYHLVPTNYLKVPVEISEYYQDKKVKVIEKYTSDEEKFWRI